MDEQKEALKRQIQTQLELLSTMEEGTEEKERETKILKDLCAIAMDHDKMNADRKADEVDRKHRTWMDYMRLGLEGAGIVVSVGVGLVTLNSVMKYEETGSFNSKASQMLLRFMQPFKKLG